MRKAMVLVLLAVCACAAGCSTAAQQSEVWKHDTMYRSWDHLRFSWGGHRDVSDKEREESMEQNWWGKETQ
jgi:hypothetical protein